MNTSGFSTRLARLVQETGLSQQQLGVTRVYSQPHSSHAGQPLAGEEVLIKDLQQVAGEITTFGSEEQAHTATLNDSATLRLLDRGARLVGASATSEYGVTAYTEPVGQDSPVNPLGARFMPGGSSGGAAVAVARGVVNIAHATDGGGSIRIPAACCGLSGLKPAHNPRIGGFTSTAHGYLARDIETTARAYALDIPDLTSAVRDGREPLRIGYTNTPFHSSSSIDPAIAAATAAVTALLTSTEAVTSVSQAPAPYSPRTFELFREVLTSRCAQLPGPLSPLTRWLKEQGQQVTELRREQLHRQLNAIGEDVLATWADFDIIATPMLACAPPAPGTFSSLPPRLNFLAQTAWTPWATLWNITGWASVSVPLVDPQSVPGRWPISLQLGAVSDRVSEAELLTLARSVSTVASALPPEGLSLAAPGDIEALSYRPRPSAHSHEH